MYLDNENKKKKENNYINTEEENKVFCSNCLQNQKLIVQLLASYDPGDDVSFPYAIKKKKKKKKKKNRNFDIHVMKFQFIN